MGLAQSYGLTFDVDCDKSGFDLFGRTRWLFCNFLFGTA